MSSYLKRLDVVHSRLANAALPHMTDETLEDVVVIFDKYQPRQRMTPGDTQRWLCALREGYEHKSQG